MKVVKVDRVDAELYERRLERLQGRLREIGVEAAAIMSAVNVYYFTGTAQRGVLIVPSTGEATLYVIRGFERALKEAYVKCVKVSGLGEVAEKLASLRRIGFEEDRLPVKLHRRLLGDATSIDISDGILELRKVKDGFEQRLLREAAKQCDLALQHAPEVLKEGASCAEITAELEKVLRREGHDGYLDMRSWGDHMPNLVVLPPGDVEPGRITAVSVGVGVSSACPVGSSRRKVGRGDVVWIDVSGRYMGYTSDVTRTFALGRPREEVVEAFRAVEEVYREVLKCLRAGVGTGEVYWRAVELVRRLGFIEGFMGRGDGKVQFIGHGVGLEVDEPPVVGRGDVALREGMALAIEPKIVGPGGWGVGLESTVIVHREACEVLDRAPTELLEV
ncbi:MAG: Xaa-Pro peptidase family protein [Candidatus Nezhaarchaeota archaeon]|nr:Xaa-Pro peptidase family protein [Candidatus Nezhaarchaeota archaeon]